jgi:hypothetical protein
MESWVRIRWSALVKWIRCSFAAGLLFQSVKTDEPQPISTARLVSRAVLSTSMDYRPLAGPGIDGCSVTLVYIEAKCKHCLLLNIEEFWYAHVRRRWKTRHEGGMRCFS